MAKVGDKVVITRKQTVEHFRIGKLAVRGKIVIVRPSPQPFGRLYGIKFEDRQGVWYYARWEFRVPRKPKY